MAFFDVDYYSTQKLLVIPQEPAAHEALQSIDRKTRFDVNDKYGILSSADWQMNTVANCTFETILESLAAAMKGTGVTEAAFNSYNLFFVKATLRRNEDADKEGNINVLFQPGPRANELITMEEPPSNGEGHRKPIEIFSIEDDKHKHDMYQRIDRMARYSLSKKYRFLMADEMSFGAFAVLDQFMFNLFQYLLYDLGHNPEKTLSSINFNDNVEVHAMRSTTDNMVQFSMRPGMNAKLIIKSDVTAEFHTEPMVSNE